MKREDDSIYLDPVFNSVGQKVYSYEFIEKLREENLERKTEGKRVLNLVPQKGFQERVCIADADLVIAGGRKGGGKAISVDSQVVTPFGMRRYGDLKIGDIITDPTNGGMEKVINIYEHPNKDLYEVMFDDGATCECCLDHLWTVRQTGYTHKRRLINGKGVDDDYRVWTFGMIKKWLDEQSQEGKHYMTGSKCKSKKYLAIPLTQPVKFTCSGVGMKRNSLDPYVIGAILGDGCITDSVAQCYDAQFCTNDNEIADEFKKAGVDMSNCTLTNENFATYYIKDDRLHEMLSACKLYGCNSKDKFIPHRYKFATIEERFSIVQGLMDTDGYVDNRGHCVYTTVSKQLAEDMRFVIESLGGSATISKKKAGYKKNGEYVECSDAYELYIKMKDTSRLFRLSRKKDRCRAFNGGASEVCRRIVGYRYIGKKDARCITVDSCGSLYAIQDFIVTHNTWVSLFKAMKNMFNPDVAMYAFRRLEDDVRRGPWKSSKQVFRGFATPKESSFEWAFLDGRGATLKMEHLQDLGKVTDRFRGAELAYIDLEELPEHTRENLDIIFDFLQVNRNTVGVKSQVVATCNPVGKSNKLRGFLDYYIDPDTNKVIPERDGNKRYMFKYGSDDTEIAWGDTWQEVYNNPRAKERIDILIKGRDDVTPEDMILTVQFIEGDYAENKILQITDKRYISRLASKGDGSVINDLSGVWVDIDEGHSLVSREDMELFFDNQEQKGDEVPRASCDVAIVGDFFVIWAAVGHHIVDMDAWFGAMSDAVIPFIEHFLAKNNIKKRNFTFDSNGLGVWISNHSAFRDAVPFNNKSAASDPKLWNNLKSESAEKWVKEVKNGGWSINSDLLKRKFTDVKGHTFTLADRLMEERLALKRKDDTGARFEIISKSQMKLEVGHSPDFIEGLIMFEPLFSQHRSPVRKGFNLWI